jgi:mitochondrial fission protein ELM1
MALIWVLLDDAAGHMNQALGVAEALNLPFEPKPIKYNDKSNLPNLLLGANLKGVATADIKAPWPDLVISAGRKTFPIARYIKKQSKAKIVQLMHPGFPAWGIDLLVVPEHDGFTPNSKTMVTIGAPNRVQPDFLSQEAAIWERTLDKFKTPRLAVLLGGDTKGITFTEQDGITLAEQVQALSLGLGSLLVSASRRTPKVFADAFKAALKQPFHFHDPATSRSNPYYAFLALSGAIVTTADSVSMMSEACTTGKPVYIYQPTQFAAPKHQQLLNKLLYNDYAMLSDGSKAISSPIPKLETSNQVAARILTLF